MSLVKVLRILEDAPIRQRLPKESFKDFERRLHSNLQEIERELLGEDLARADVDAEAICVHGTTFRRVSGPKRPT
jgi:hypothetical protein